jgi:hypothetical protein
MRTTITLDADTAALLQRLVREQGISFKQAVNDAIRAGLRARPAKKPFRTRTAKMGEPTVDLDRALQIAAAFEDDELVRKMQHGK